MGLRFKTDKIDNEREREGERKAERQRDSETERGEGRDIYTR